MSNEGVLVSLCCYCSSHSGSDDTIMCCHRSCLSHHHMQEVGRPLAMNPSAHIEDGKCLTKMGKIKMKDKIIVVLGMNGFRWCA